MDNDKKYILGREVCIVYNMQPSLVSGQWNILPCFSPNEQSGHLNVDSITTATTTTTTITTTNTATTTTTTTITTTSTTMSLRIWSSTVGVILYQGYCLCFGQPKFCWAKHDIIFPLKE